jgi:hypothetical protein
MSTGKYPYTEFLKKTGEREYPAEYLLSRIRARRALLIEDWKDLLLSDPLSQYVPARYGEITGRDYPEAVWRFLLNELGWVYIRMNSELRRIFNPFFLYAELRTIFTCLRYARGGKRKEIERLLLTSLLSKGVRKILESGASMSSTIEGIEDRLISISDRFKGLGDVFNEKGLIGAEQFITIAYLENTVCSGLHPVVKGFFVTVIDARNILSLFRHIRMDGKVAPQFVFGGRISRALFAGIESKRDVAGLERLVMKLTRFSVEGLDIANVENSLYRVTTRFLRRAGRDALGAGVILDYIWRSFIEARNLSILFYGNGIERNVLAEELVQ